MKCGLAWGITRGLDADRRSACWLLPRLTRAVALPCTAQATMTAQRSDVTEGEMPRGVSVRTPHHSAGPERSEGHAGRSLPRCDRRSTPPLAFATDPLKGLEMDRWRTGWARLPRWRGQCWHGRGRAITETVRGSRCDPRRKPPNHDPTGAPDSVAAMPVPRHQRPPTGLGRPACRRFPQQRCLNRKLADRAAIRQSRADGPTGGLSSAAAAHRRAATSRSRSQSGSKPQALRKTWRKPRKSSSRRYSASSITAGR